MMDKTSYLIGLGSNRRHGRHGAPERVIEAAASALPGLALLSGIHRTRALGPAGRDFANAVALITCNLAPAGLFGTLKEIEHSFGRRGGRRWGPRVLDLDILLWSGGAYDSAALTIPHTAFRERTFVLGPLAEIAPQWRDPMYGLTVRQLLFRHVRRRPVVDRNEPRA